MEIFINGMKIGKGTNEVLPYVGEESFKPLSSGMKEVSLTAQSVETNIRLMSEKTRLWCKQIKRNGKIYY